MRATYFRCPGMGLVFAHPECYLSAEDERAVYDRHQNSPDDSVIVNSFSLFDRWPRGCQGKSRADFGSGPAPRVGDV
ncbi:MAG: hypothetical protein CM1200mP2_19540 [Planctomycetaceae bacterium]|nr:MAG: hypothetical protein CM1200mP2_19540 [Planctomycetaceae bacterium]